MGTDIINTIESLNTRNFSDYEFLVNDLRTVISKFDTANTANIIQDGNFEEYYFRINSIDYIKNIFNKKLEEFRTNFFWGEELIRGVIIQNPDILDRIDRQKVKYFYSLSSQTIEKWEYGPTAFDKTQTSLRQFDRNYKSGYYISKKSNSSYQTTHNKKQEGCFVATFAYDSYDHYNVLKLRQFRDEILSNSKFGIFFIKIYYRISPALVLFLEKIKFPKSPLRLLISGLILLIRNK